MNLSQKDSMNEHYTRLSYKGKAVYLGIRRRRWRNKTISPEVKSDYSFIAEGSKLTIELDFFKGTGRDREDTISNIASYYGVKANLLQRHYKKKSVVLRIGIS
jgi:hypothetical protein